MAGSTLVDPGGGSRRSVAPRNAFAEVGYYTVRDENLEPLALMEVLFEDFENHAARVYRFLLDGGSPRILMRKHAATSLSLWLDRLFEANRLETSIKKQPKPTRSKSSRSAPCIRGNGGTGFWPK
jgi:hypothetical protein